MSAAAPDRIVGHPAVRDLLRHTVDADRIPHAMLFSGPDGVGKRTLALRLARDLIAGENAEERDRFDLGVHERFVLYQDLEKPVPIARETLLPVAGDESSLLEHYGLLEADGWMRGVAPRSGALVIDRIERNPEKFTGRLGIPFADVLEKELGALEKSKKASAVTVDIARRLFSAGTSRALYRRSLGIDLINGKGDGKYFRTVQSLLARSSGGGWRVAILDDAHKMTDAAENAFLKTLEEPPPNTLLILVTSDASALLPTTVSRCARVSFDALPTETVATFLRETQGFAEADAGLLASLSGGSIGKALEMGARDFVDRRGFAKRLLPEIASGNLGRCLEMAGSHLAATEAGSGPVRDAQRGQAGLLLEVLALCFRDCALASVGAGVPSISGLDESFLRELAARQEPSVWERLFDRTEIAISDLSRSVEPRLALEALFVDALPAPGLAR